MDETPADLMRRAAQQLRADAAAIRTELDTNPYWRAPGRDHDERYRLGVAEGLGGVGGDYAAQFTPALADLLADAWEAEASDMANYPAVLLPGGVGITYYADEPNPVWTAAYRAANAFLVTAGEPPGEPAPPTPGAKRRIQLLAAIQKEGGDWSPARARDLLACHGHAVDAHFAAQVMKTLAAQGYLEPIRPRAFTYRLKDEH